MYICFYVSTIVLYLVLRCFENQDKMKRLYIILITLLLCFCTAFRNIAMGNDTYAYYMHFERMANADLGELIENTINSITSSSNNANKDPGYSVLAKIAYTILLGNYEIYQFLIALLILSAIGYLVYNYVQDFSGYLLSYCFYISIFYHYLPNSATRQSIALGIFLWSAIIWIKKRNIFFPLMMILIASFIHKSVLIGILPFLVMYMKNKNKLIIYTIIGTALFFAMGSYLTVLMGNLINSENYAAYVQSGYYERTGSRPFVYILQMLALFVLNLYKRQNLNEIPVNEQLIQVCFFLSIVFVPMILVDPSLIRLDAYFAIWGVVFIPYILENFEKRTKHWQIIYILLFVLTFGRPILSGVPTYKFKWEQMHLHKRYGEIRSADQLPKEMPSQFEQVTIS